MANTNKLRTIVEPELVKEFCLRYKCKPVDLPSRDYSHIFFKMRPDFVAYNCNRKILYIGEVTVSGYMGRKGKDFHIGGARKFAEVFTKFFLFTTKENKKEIICNIEEKCGIEVSTISCHLVVPDKSKFINALGYREQLLNKGVMKLDVLPLSNKAKTALRETLHTAVEEMTK